MGEYAVLLAGGQGTRFWPLSRVLEPKQFLSLHKESSLFEQTILRIKPLVKPSNIYVASSGLYKQQIFESCERFSIPVENIIFEPTGKNTAPSIAVTVKVIANRDPGARISVLPCDHLIKADNQFRMLLKKAFALCDKNIVIFGIKPHRPATGYGYIQVTGTQGHKDTSRHKLAGGKVTGMKVKRFTEKPDLVTANKFLKSGDYYWNSGIFIGSASVFLDEFKNSLPGLFKNLSGIKDVSDINRHWEGFQAISFDYGVLEKAKDIIMISAGDIGWSDLGSWQAWDEIISKDRSGNVLKADVINLDSKNITVLGSKRLIATIGLDDLIIVDTPDALLVTKKDRSESVKKVVEELKAKGRPEHHEHKTVKRPWGSYTVLELGDGFKVKLVEVKPRHSLSLQYHKRRSEHWVVVEGTARITRGKKTSSFSANESTYIPIGCAHRLSNPNKDRMLKIIEVQAGKYLEEDDIVRIKDDFGRS